MPVVTRQESPADPKVAVERNGRRITARQTTFRYAGVKDLTPASTAYVGVSTTRTRVQLSLLCRHPLPRESGATWRGRR